MKLTITMKDPDGFYESFKDSVRASVDSLGLSSDEANAVYEVRAEQVREKLSRWFEYDEYVTIEVDLDAMTATVVAQ